MRAKQRLCHVFILRGTHLAIFAAKFSAGEILRSALLSAVARRSIPDF